MNKEQIRKKVLETLRQQKQRERENRSLVIKEKLFRSPEFRSAGVVMFYVAKDYEVDTRPMIRHALQLGKRVAVPVTNVREKRLIASEVLDPEKEFSFGPYGIKQPKREFVREIPIRMLDLIVVPGVVFDRKGSRLGHGLGYYDRFLKGAPKTTPLIGLAFRFQVVDDLPALSSHDVPLTKLITA